MRLSPPWPSHDPERLSCRITTRHSPRSGPIRQTISPRRLPVLNGFKRRAPVADAHSLFIQHGT